MKKLLLAVVFCVCASASQAQLVQQTKPPSLNGFGTLSATAASTLLSTLTKGPNSPNYPTTFPNTAVTIKSSPASAGNVFICPLGGTCSITVGIPIAVGGVETYTITDATVPTVFATTTATIIVEW